MCEPSTSRDWQLRKEMSLTAQWGALLRHRHPSKARRHLHLSLIAQGGVLLRHRHPSKARRNLHHHRQCLPMLSWREAGCTTSTSSGLGAGPLALVRAVSIPLFLAIRTAAIATRDEDLFALQLLTLVCTLRCAISFLCLQLKRWCVHSDI